MPADVKRAARPWSHSWSPHTPGPQMLAQGSAWDPPGSPQGAKALGGLKPHPRPVALPSLHACSLEGTRAPRAQTTRGLKQPPYQDRSECSVI